MKKLGLLTLFTLALTSNAFALDIKSMNCEVYNFAGLKLGTADLEGGQVFMKLGVFANLLWVNKTTENTVVAMTKGQTWDYIFKFEEDFSEDTQEYEGILSQQYALGFAGPQIPFAKINCKVFFAAE